MISRISESTFSFLFFRRQNGTLVYKELILSKARINIHHKWHLLFKVTEINFLRFDPTFSFLFLNRLWLGLWTWMSKNFIWRFFVRFLKSKELTKNKPVRLYLFENVTYKLDKNRTPAVCQTVIGSILFFWFWVKNHSFFVVSLFFFLPKIQFYSDPEVTLTVVALFIFPTTNI